MKILIVLDFEVYIKTKIGIMANAEGIEDVTSKPDNFSSRSFDESKASAYFTPTDDPLSPQAPQTSPIHVNYLGENELLKSWKPGKKQQHKFVIDRNGQKVKLSRRTNRLRGGYLAEEDFENGDLGIPFMGDFYGDAIEDEYYPRHNKKRSSLALSNSEMQPLKPIQPIIDPIPSTSYGFGKPTRHIRQKSNSSRDFYYSLEDVVGASNADSYATAATTATTTPKSIIKKQNSKIELDESGLITALVKLEDGLDVNCLVKRGSSNGRITAKHSESMPEISQVQPNIHGKHVILTLEST